MEYEVAIVGGGPAGLACAIRIKRLNPERTVCVLEKAASIGAHSLSGAVLEPGPLEQLLPEWKAEYTGMKVPAAEDDFRVLTPTGSFKPIPDFWAGILPKSMTAGTPLNNHGNYIISLGQLTPWLAAKAESLGVDVFPGFAAAAAAFDEAGNVKGVQVGDMGLNRDGTPGPNFAAGIEIHSKVTVLAEGCRGSISKQLIKKFDLGRGHCPQTFALGYKPRSRAFTRRSALECWPASIWPTHCRARVSTPSGAVPRAAANSSACATSSRRSKRGCGSASSTRRGRR
jgi:electron-transferring-flavoprotein dehydrogenase